MLYTLLHFKRPLFDASPAGLLGRRCGGTPFVPTPFAVPRRPGQVKRDRAGPGCGRRGPLGACDERGLALRCLIALGLARPV